MSKPLDMPLNLPILGELADTYVWAVRIREHYTDILSRTTSVDPYTKHTVHKSGDLYSDVNRSLVEAVAAVDHLLDVHAALTSAYRLIKPVTP